MAARRKKPAPTKADTTPAAAPAVVRALPPQRDLRPLIYLVLNQLFAIGYAYVLIAVIPNRLMSALVHLWALPVLMQGMAIGMGLHFVPTLRRIGWWIGVVCGSLILLTTVLLIVRVLVSAAFLSGVYGAFGKAAAMSALIGVALVIEIVALVPILQVKYLMTRAGRRTFAMPT